MINRRQILASAAALGATGFLPVTSYPSERLSPRGYIRTNWSKDPFSYGSYSFIAKGAHKRQTRDLARPVGKRLFFAGEATHPDYNSTVHAAYESGLIAAELVETTGAQSVGIIGAGMSGLTAAKFLADLGRDVTVVEARDRIGGRIWTDNSLGAALDLGASWIHGIDGNPVKAIADELGIKTKETGNSFVMRGTDGRDMSDEAGPPWLEEVTEVQQSAGAGSNEINGRAYWIDLDYGGMDVVFQQGYGQVFEHHAGQYDIEFRRIVKRVIMLDESVAVVDSEQQETRFDALIITVPLGALKRGTIDFTPPLPSRKQAAIDALGYGLLDKFYLRFDRVFWDADKTWIITPENGLPPGQFNQWLNFYPLIEEPILLAFNGAKPAKDLAELDDQELIKRALDTLSSAYPDL
ncbi:MAG: FAD-dependent oxidoreductase [Pseudomonadota bacterium]